MKIAIAIACLAAFSAAPSLASDGYVSHKSLKSMGLAAMKDMSDAQGMAVRGQSKGGNGGIHFGSGLLLPPLNPGTHGHVTITITTSTVAGATAH
jgi:hypothetical protein